MSRAAVLALGATALGAAAYYVWPLTVQRVLGLIKTHPAPVDTSTVDVGSVFPGVDSLLPGADMDTPAVSEPGKPVPKGIRNNNPLNIEAGQPWQGVTGDDGRFAIFETSWFGIRAAGRLLKTYRTRYGIDTVAGIVNRWAPPSENPSKQYAQFVAGKAGVNQHQQLTDVDYPRVVAAMIHFENGYNPYDQNTVNSAVAAGLA